MVYNRVTYKIISFGQGSGLVNQDLKNDEFITLTSLRDVFPKGPP